MVIKLKAVMDIRDKIFYAGLFLFCFSYISSQQSRDKIPAEFQNRLYQIMFQQVSQNGQWAAFKKAYEKTNDTLVVVDARKRNRVLLEKGGVGNFYFASNNVLFYQINKDVIRYDIAAKNEKVYQDVAQYAYMEEAKKFLLFCKTDNQNYVKVIDEEGREQESFSNAELFKVFNSSAIVITGKDGKFLIWKYDGSKKELLFSHDKKIKGVLNVNDNGLLFTEENPGTKNMVICYYDVESKILKRLSDKWDGRISQVGTSFVNHSGEILLNAWVKKDAPEEVVDIWYGNATDLRTKFYGKDEKKEDIIWNPHTDSVTVLKNDKCTNYISIGNNPYGIICFDEFQNEDFTGKEKVFSVYQYDIDKESYSLIGQMATAKTVDRSGRYILSKVSGTWYLYDLLNESTAVLPSFASIKPVFSYDSESIVFEEIGSLSIYNIKSKMVQRIDLGSKSHVEIINSEMENLGNNVSFTKNSIDLTKPIILKLLDPDDYSTGLAIIKDGLVKYIERDVPYTINSIKWRSDFSKISYVVENINLPPQLRVFGTNYKILYDSNRKDSISRTIKSQLYSYKNNEGKALHGILLYPVSFNPQNKYPMIVNIYENQSKLRNKFLMDGFSGSTDAFNARYYLKRGYFVFLPDIVYGDKGTGYSALESVELGMDAIKNNPSIDFNNVALIGFSHGGFETNFIATKSKRFKTYLAGGGNCDLVRSYFSYNYNFYSPFYFQYENGQYRMPRSFVEDKQLYINNSPVYFAEQVTAPILLWAGMKDQNIYWEQTMEFYLALKRNNKTVTSLFYPNEAHGFQKTESRIDIFKKVSDWIDYHLKGLKTDWIDRMYKK